MAGVTDLAFRLICKSYGAGGLTTEMVSAKGLYYKDKKTASLMMLDDRERPASIQIFGSEPDIIGQIIPKVEEFSPSAIDINMGCPMPKIVNNAVDATAVAYQLTYTCLMERDKEVRTFYSDQVSIYIFPAIIGIIGIKQLLLYYLHLLEHI